MCNRYRNRLSLDAYRRLAEEVGVALEVEGAAPNLEPREDVAITETAPVLRAGGAEGGALALAQLRWSWPGPGGKPVYNFRSDGRRFPSGRCLVPCDGFFEFTAPETPDGAPAPKRARKTKWLFTMTGAPAFALAGVWRPQADAAGGAAFSLLTCPPGPDMAPYHDRQVVVFRPGDWRAWLWGEAPESLLAPAPAGTLEVERSA